MCKSEEQGLVYVPAVSQEHLLAKPKAMDCLQLLEYFSRAVVISGKYLQVLALGVLLPWNGEYPISWSH